MATYTTNLNLKKPTTSEMYNVLDWNNNSDKIDAAYGTLNSQMTVLGSIVNGTNIESSVSVPNGTATAISSLELTKGKWVIVGCIDWSGNASGYRQIAIGNATNPGRPLASTTLPPSDTSKQTYQQITRLLSTNGETITFYALQNSGSALTAYPYSYAIKVGN